MSLIKPYQQCMMHKSKFGREIKISEYYDCQSKNPMLLWNNNSTNDSYKQIPKARDVSLDYRIETNIELYNKPFTYKRIKPSDNCNNDKFEIVQTNYGRLRRNLSEEHTKNLAQRKSNKISKSPSPITKSNLLTTSNTSAYNNNCLKRSMNNNTNAHFHNKYTSSYTKYASSSHCISTNSTSNTSSYNNLNLSHLNPDHFNSNSNYKFYQALNDINQDTKLIYSNDTEHKPTQSSNLIKRNNATTSAHYEYIGPDNYNDRNECNYNYENYIRNISATPNLNQKKKAVYNNTQSEFCNKQKWLENDINRGYSYTAHSQNALSKSESIKEESKSSFIKSTKPDSQRDIENIDTIEEMHFSFVSMIQNTKRIISIQEAFSGRIAHRDYRQNKSII